MSTPTESNGNPNHQPTRTIFIEVRDGAGITEVWEPDAELMGELGWIRAEQASEIATAIAQTGQEQLNAVALGMGSALKAEMAANGHPIPDLETNGRATALDLNDTCSPEEAERRIASAKMELAEMMKPRTGKLPSERLQEIALESFPKMKNWGKWDSLEGQMILTIVGKFLDERMNGTQTGKFISERAYELANSRTGQGYAASLAAAIDERFGRG